MHERGELTDEQYDKSRVQMIAATQRAAERAAEAAREEAKKKGGVTDIEELRERARRARGVSSRQIDPIDTKPKVVEPDPQPDVPTPPGDPEREG